MINISNITKTKNLDAKQHKNTEIFFLHILSLQLSLVALNQPHTGNLMGLDMADRMCYEQAKAMGLAPNYRAFISSHRQDLVHVVYPGFRENLPITNLRVSRLLHPSLASTSFYLVGTCTPTRCVCPSGRRDV